MVESIKQGKGTVVPLAVDLVVIVSATFFAGIALNRLDNVEKAVITLSNTQSRLSVLENEEIHTRQQLDMIDSKLERLLERTGIDPLVLHK